MRNKRKNKINLCRGKGRETLKSVSAGRNTIGVGNAVIHVDHIDGKKSEVRGRERRRRVQRLNLLEKMKGVTTVLSPTKEWNQGVEYAVQPH